ncbi:MAG: formylglycine-generating enzyme family protein [Myxococcota bacterium]|nr:formylglycine-generating enzyme family protein [Myxococcota bacterium]
MLLFPLIAASFILWAGADSTPALGADGVKDTAEPFDVGRCAKHPPSKSRIRPRLKKRGRALAVTSQQPSGEGESTAGHTTSATGRSAQVTDEPPKEAIGAVALRRGPTGCPADMVAIGTSHCIDIYEAALVEDLPGSQERPWPFFEVVPSNVIVHAVSVRGVYPQGYISGVRARDACERSGKRLCAPDEWRNACMGPKSTVFPYGNVREVGRCNDNGRSSMRFFNPQLDAKPEHRWMWGAAGNMSDPRLNQLDGTLTRTGERSGCTNEYGVFDMVGNLHEWVDDPAGTFQGGYYLDTHLNGDGCRYRTTAHAMGHLDYSTGFRCCADIER